MTLTSKTGGGDTAKTYTEQNSIKMIVILAHRGWVAQWNPPSHERKSKKSLKDSKAAGPDEIPSELLKLGGDSVTSALDRPEDWTQSTFVPLHKKGDPTVCANYRTISLISHANKVLLKVILSRIKSQVEYEVAEEQANFRPGRGTHNHLCSLRMIRPNRTGNSTQATAMHVLH